VNDFSLIREFSTVKKFGFLPDDINTNAVRVREMCWLAKFISSESAALEFGVYSGTTINALSRASTGFKIHGFDSFEGLPEDWDTGEKYIKKERFDMGGNMPKVEENVTLHKGWFSDTLPSFLENDCSYASPIRIGFINIDSDLYSSAIEVLMLLEESKDHPGIEPGCIIRFDELCCWRSVFGEASPQNEANRVSYSKWKEHEWKALTEWINKYNRKVVPLCRNWFQSGTFIVTQ